MSLVMKRIITNNKMLLGKKKKKTINSNLNKPLEITVIHRKFKEKNVKRHHGDIVIEIQAVETSTSKAAQFLLQITSKGQKKEGEEAEREPTRPRRPETHRPVATHGLYVHRFEERNLKKNRRWGECEYCLFNTKILLFLGVLNVFYLCVKIPYLLDP